MPRRVKLTVLAVLSDETASCMRLLGAQRVEDLGPQYVRIIYSFFSPVRTDSNEQINTRIVEQQIFDGPSGLDTTPSVLKSKL